VVKPWNRQAQQWLYLLVVLGNYRLGIHWCQLTFGGKYLNVDIFVKCIQPSEFHAGEAKQTNNHFMKLVPMWQVVLPWPLDSQVTMMLRYKWRCVVIPYDHCLGNFFHDLHFWMGMHLTTTALSGKCWIVFCVYDLHSWLSLDHLIHDFNWMRWVDEVYFAVQDLKES
jgi:hypothetical protein